MIDPLEMWKGDWGDEYTQRNNDLGTLVPRINMFKRCLKGHAANGWRILEVGANIGLNGLALETIANEAGWHWEIDGVEPNKSARDQLLEIARVGFPGIPTPSTKYSMVFTCGVLIHVAPEDLYETCQKIYTASGAYILCIEYFSDKPQEKEYRGHEGLLWTRDFGKFWLDNYPVKLLDYGFFWKEVSHLDNLTWQIFRKTGE